MFRVVWLVFGVFEALVESFPGNQCGSKVFYPSNISKLIWKLLGNDKASQKEKKCSKPVFLHDVMTSKLSGTDLCGQKKPRPNYSMRVAEWKKQILIKQHLVNVMTMYVGLLLVLDEAFFDGSHCFCQWPGLLLYQPCV